MMDRDLRILDPIVSSVTTSTPAITECECLLCLYECVCSSLTRVMIADLLMNIFTTENFSVAVDFYTDTSRLEMLSEIQTRLRHKFIGLTKICYTLKF